MSGTAWVGVAIVALILVGVAAVGAGGFATTSTTTSSEGPAMQLSSPPADGSHGIVTGIYKSKSGVSIFGWDITSSTWEAQVMFVPPAGCGEPADTEVVADGPCATVPAEGRLSGGGTDGEGNRLWNVAFEVSEACQDVLAVNDRWPTTKQECAAR